MAEQDRELVEQAHQLRELTATSHWGTLTRFVQEAADRRVSHMIGARDRTLDEYARDAGWVEGVRFVLNAADHAQQQAERSGE